MLCVMIFVGIIIAFVCVGGWMMMPDTGTNFTPDQPSDPTVPNLAQIATKLYQEQVEAIKEEVLKEIDEKLLSKISERAKEGKHELLYASFYDGYRKVRDLKDKDKAIILDLACNKLRAYGFQVHRDFGDIYISW
jgi:hypothetical protein